MARAAFGIALRNDEVLLVKLPIGARYGGHWTLPGGMVDEAETMEEGVIREIREETGMTFSIDKSIWTGHEGAKNHDIEVFVGSATGEIKIQKTELDDAQWFQLSEAVKLRLAYDDKRLLEELIFGRANTVNR